MKSCPFCGSKDLDIVENYGSAWVWCISCLCAGPASDNGVEAERTWNTRKLEEEYKFLIDAGC